MAAVIRPQAKGRVERVNRTLQDRLVKELTRAGVSDQMFVEQLGGPSVKQHN